MVMGEFRGIPRNSLTTKRCTRHMGGAHVRMTRLHPIKMPRTRFASSRLGRVRGQNCRLKLTTESSGKCNHSSLWNSAEYFDPTAALFAAYMDRPCRTRPPTTVPPWANRSSYLQRTPSFWLRPLPATETEARRQPQSDYLVGRGLLSHQDFLAIENPF
jgi:hypothetical protein